MTDFGHLIADRSLRIDASGIRRAFDLAASLPDPINLSIGLPDFDVPDTVKQAACEAIQGGMNRYTPTQGLAELRARLIQQLAAQYPQTWGESGADRLPADSATLITSGVSGALVLLMLATLQPGDEAILPDPYFVMYRHLVTLAGGKAVYADTYPDFRLTPDRVAPLLTDRTKLVVMSSPSNPTGVVAPREDCRALLELCRSRGVLLVADEIYDAFYYDGDTLPSPSEVGRDFMLLKGFSKTYAMTGWRLGYCVGPKPIVEQMTKLQQYSFVCAPSMAQVAGVAAVDVDLSAHVAAYRRKRDLVVEKLSPHYELTVPQGAFYAFPKVPEHLGIGASTFIEKAIEHNVIVIPGSVFSERDTHFRISYACDDKKLEEGLDVLIKLAK